MKCAQLIKAPMHASNPPSKDELGKLVNHTIYRGMIGSLLCLIASRHDIIYSVYLCARFQFDPRKSHLKVVKRILCYLVVTSQAY